MPGKPEGDPLRATRAGSRLLPYVYGSGVESVLLAGQLTWTRSRLLVEVLGRRKFPGYGVAKSWDCPHSAAVVIEV